MQSKSGGATVDEFLSIIMLYKLPVCAGVSSALALSLFGCFLAARERAIQTLVLSQSATFGALIGMAIVLTYFKNAQALIGEFIPLATALLTAGIAYFQSERLIAQHHTSKSSFFIFLYLCFLALSYLISSLLPSLESHMTRYIFGDLATLSDNDSYLVLGSSFAILITLIRYRERLTKISFLEMVMHIPMSSPSDKWMDCLFKTMFLVYVCLCTQTLGLLFTLSLLFLPTILSLLSANIDYRRHQNIAGFIGSTGTILGLLISLAVTNLPTVPMVVLMVIVTGVFASWI